MGLGSKEIPMGEVDPMAGVEVPIVAEVEGEEQFHFVWNNFQDSLISTLEHLRAQNYFTDVTISCEGQSIKAHKVILCASSPYFKEILDQNPVESIITLQEVPLLHLNTILDYFYCSEISLAQDQLPSILTSAVLLKVSGLIDDLEKAIGEDQQQFDFQRNRADMVDLFKNLTDESAEQNCFTDVSIDCNGETTRAHKVILWAFSTYFKNILEQNPEQPTIILGEVGFLPMTALLKWMYAGKFTVSQSQLNEVLLASEKLQIKGLFQPPQMAPGMPAGMMPPDLIEINDEPE